jgi:hypothetical protein
VGAVRGVRGTAVLGREDDDRKLRGPRALLKRGEGWSLDAESEILHGLDLGGGRKAAKHGALVIAHYLRTSQSVVQQAPRRVARGDSSVAGLVEVLEPR